MVMAWTMGVMVDFDKIFILLWYFVSSVNWFTICSIIFVATRSVYEKKIIYGETFIPVI